MTMNRYQTSPYNRGTSPPRRDSPMRSQSQHHSGSSALYNSGAHAMHNQYSSQMNTSHHGHHGGFAASHHQNSYYGSGSGKDGSQSPRSHSGARTNYGVQQRQQNNWGNSPITQVQRDQEPSLVLPLDFVPPEPDPRTFTPLLPPKDRTMMNKITLVLDLDETLVHSSFKPVSLVDMLIDIELDGQMHSVYVRKRPFVEEFLARVSELFEVVILTASLEVYADPVLDELDYDGYWIHHRLFRDSCANLNGNYIKDLSYLGRPLHQTIIVDNSPTSYLFQPRNAIPITSWFDDPTDTELRDMLAVLERCARTDNIYPVLDAYRQHLGIADQPKRW